MVWLFLKATSELIYYKILVGLESRGSPRALQRVEVAIEGFMGGFVLYS